MSSTHSPKTVLVVIGTRPEAIKLAPVVHALREDARFIVKVVATGQHKEMVENLFEWFDIQPDFKLDVMQHKQPLAHLAGKLLHGLFNVIEQVHPDIVMVQGDTNSCFIGALTAYYGYDHFWQNKLRNTPIQIAHVEAGLRTHNNYSPFPEEVNRRLVGHLAHWNFAPTETAADALAAEGIKDKVFITGNTVIDALLITQELITKKPLPPIPELADAKGRMMLVTGHRRESYGDGFANICKALKQLARRYPDDHIVYPVHLNRHVYRPVHEMLDEVKNIYLLEPLDYPNFVDLMQRSYLILTDSGGVQEEGPSLGKPVLVMREVTERPEAIAAGTAKLVGTEVASIVQATSELLDDEPAYQAMAHAVNPYGDGRATQRIINLLAGEQARQNHFTAQAA